MYKDCLTKFSFNFGNFSFCDYFVVPFNTYTKFCCIYYKGHVEIEMNLQLKKFYKMIAWTLFVNNYNCIQQIF